MAALRLAPSFLGDPRGAALVAYLNSLGAETAPGPEDWAPPADTGAAGSVARMTDAASRYMHVDYDPLASPADAR